MKSEAKSFAEVLINEIENDNSFILICLFKKRVNVSLTVYPSAAQQEQEKTWFDSANIYLKIMITIFPWEIALTM